MGYEQFVKKIFPFIGNQYGGIEEQEGKHFQGEIRVSVQQIADKQGFILYFNFKNGTIEEAREEETEKFTGKLCLGFTEVEGAPTFRNIQLIYPRRLEASNIFAETAFNLISRDKPYILTALNGEHTIELNGELFGLEDITLEEAENDTLVVICK